MTFHHMSSIAPLLDEVDRPTTDAHANDLGPPGPGLTLARLLPSSASSQESGVRPRLPILEHWATTGQEDTCEDTWVLSSLATRPPAACRSIRSLRFLARNTCILFVSCSLITFVPCISWPRLRMATFLITIFKYHK